MENNMNQIQHVKMVRSKLKGRFKFFARAYLIWPDDGLSNNLILRPCIDYPNGLIHKRTTYGEDDINASKYDYPENLTLFKLFRGLTKPEKKAEF